MALATPLSIQELGDSIQKVHISGDGYFAALRHIMHILTPDPDS
jgi:hypothetical protein